MIRFPDGTTHTYDLDQIACDDADHQTHTETELAMLGSFQGHTVRDRKIQKAMLKPERVPFTRENGITHYLVVLAFARHKEKGGAVAIGSGNRQSIPPLRDQG